MKLYPPLLDDFDNLKELFDRVKNIESVKKQIEGRNYPDLVAQVQAAARAAKKAEAAQTTQESKEIPAGQA